MVRLTAILLLLWTLLLGPALCMGGLLEHSCGCESDATCQHEESCSTDPCSDVLKQAGSKELLGDVTLRARGELSGWECGTMTPRCLPGPVPPPIPADRPRYACAPSDRPLRI